MKTENRNQTTPNWANFKARDFDGQWWWYAEEPRIGNHTYGWVSEGRMEAAGPEECCQVGWKYTL